MEGLGTWPSRLAFNGSSDALKELLDSSAVRSLLERAGAPNDEHCKCQRDNQRDQRVEKLCERHWSSATLVEYLAATTRAGASWAGQRVRASVQQDLVVT